MAAVQKMTLSAITAQAQTVGLTVRGALHEDGQTVVLLGPDEPAFWPLFNASDEFSDGLPDPLDRYSKRVITALIDLCGAARAVFPSDGPPYPSFYQWAIASGQAFASPIQFLVHETAGLFISYRGALVFDGQLELPPAAQNPCDSCVDKPCLKSCPVGALSDLYDVDACKNHLRSADSAGCMTSGCAARRACPISQSFPRRAPQSAFHMRAFLK